MGTVRQGRQVRVDLQGRVVNGQLQFLQLRQVPQRLQGGEGGALAADAQSLQTGQRLDAVQAGQALRPDTQVCQVGQP